jgi:hypothetical protein
MTKRMSWASIAAVFAVPLWLLAVPASAQGHRSGGSSGGGGHASGAAAGGGGHAAPAGGGGAAGGGGGGHAVPAGGGGAGAGGGGRVAGSTPAGGAQSSGGGGAARSGSGMGSGMAVPRSAAGTTTSAGSAPSTPAGTRAVPHEAGKAPQSAGAPAYARPRDGEPVVGHAVPRTGSVPVVGGGTTIVVPGYYGGFYPWAFGGLGFYGYGFGTGFFDPWFDPYGYDPYGFDAPAQTYSSSDTGGLKLKIKPSDATVYIDGYYVGVVDDYDGVFQKLSIEPGTHRVEIRAPGYESLSFDVRIEPGHTTTYRGELKKLPN